MLDAILILSRGGALLFQKIYVQDHYPSHHAVHSLLTNVLLEDRHEPHYAADNDLATSHLVDTKNDIVLVITYQKLLRLPYLDALLAATSDAFAHHLRAAPPHERDNLYPCDAFSATFDALQAEAESRAVSERKQQRRQRTFAESKKYNNTRQAQREEAIGEKPKPVAAAAARAEEAGAALGGGGDGGETEDGLTSAERVAARVAKLKAGARPPGARRKKGKKGDAGGEEDDADEAADGAGKKKEKRAWDGGEPLGKKSLDFSKRGADGKIEVARAAKVDVRRVDLDAALVQPSSAKAAPAESTLSWALRSLTGGGVPISQEMLEPVLDKLRQRLTEKNVAMDISDQLLKSVGASLLGKELGSLENIRAAATSALSDALLRVLTPAKRIDVLADVERARAQARPYVIVFVGVNGVGKSTSLSKVAYYLKSNGFVPMLCACDTFRSGAVEQLRVHSQSLDVPLYEKGYGRDAAGIATDGISHARQMGHDVVLVDTAGRMQDNEPLMRSLAKLVHVNSPDLILFVGEALAGNDSIDQVNGFNSALADFSTTGTPRLIDGLVLTKFDTIGDKVGTALSLVYTTRKPIVFVGVGQTYADMRNLNVEHVKNCLLA